jgi:hypothetical protein
MTDVLAGTEFAQYEAAFVRSIRTAWNVIAPDVFDSPEFEETLENVIDVVSDCGYVSMYGGFSVDMEKMWSRFRKNSSSELKKQLYTEALRYYI